MTDYKRMAVFAAVVDAGSLSAAGRRLGMSASAVSQHLRRLESDFGVALLNRSTRRLTLTDAGQRIAGHCQAMVAAADAARQQLNQLHDLPIGQLRLAAPQGLARHIAPALSPLLARNPDLSLHLLLDDERIDLVAESVDLALRVGRMPNSAWVARRLCDIECVFCAAPDYLEARPPITSPEDLAHQQWLTPVRQSGITESPVELQLSGPHGEQRTVSITPRVRSNSRQNLLRMCTDGLGLAHLARLEVDDELRSGALVSVLPAWTRPTYPVWAVTPQRDTQPAKVRYAIEAMQGYLSSLPGSRS